MLGFKNLKFEGLITYIEKDIASIRAIGEDGEKSSMEIPKKELIDSNIIFKPGVVFLIILKQRWRWEKLVFKPIKKTPVSKEDFDQLLKYYEARYGDI